MLFKTWNEKHLNIIFTNTLRVLDNNTYDISKFVQVHDSPFLQEALNITDTDIPAAHPYKHYCFLNLDAAPALVIIAADITIR